MQPAVEFLTYCSGLGILGISISFAVRLLMADKKRNRSEYLSNVTHSQEPNTDGLSGRLHSFQTTKFAPQIENRANAHKVVILPDRSQTSLPKRLQNSLPKKLKKEK